MKRLFYILVCLSAVFSPVLAQKSTDNNKSINIGQVIYRMPAMAEFELVNTTNEDIVIEQIKSSCGCTKVDYPKNLIPNGASFKVQVTYDAKQMGHFEKQVGLYPSNNSTPFILTIKGVVVNEIHDFNGQYDFAMNKMSVDKVYIEYDDVNTGDRPFQEIHIKNTSNEVIQPVVMHLPSYLQAEIAPTTIAPGRTGVARLTLISEQVKSLGLTQTTVYLGSKPGEKVNSANEIGISTILLPNFEELTGIQLANAPRMELSEEEVVLNFGKKKKATSFVTIKNTGKAVLDISSLQMFTSGLKISLGKSKLQPEEETKLKISADKKDLKNLKSLPRILMITNDPSKPKRIITVK